MAMLPKQEILFLIQVFYSLFQHKDLLLRCYSPSEELIEIRLHPKDLRYFSLILSE